MLQISEKLKKIYRTDQIPMRQDIVKKELIICFTDIDLLITNEKIYSESMKITESLCSEEDLTFGACEAAQFEITIANVGEEIKGKEFFVSQVLNDTLVMPLGTYVVDSVKRRDDLIFRDIVAYDNMTRFDINIAEWYNSLIFPITIKELRTKLCNYVGVQFEEQELLNDDVTIDKTITLQTMTGRDLLRYIGEINAVFGHITRENRFKFIDLNNCVNERLSFTGKDEQENEIGIFQSISCEDYTVAGIDSLTIRTEEDDIGITVGEKTENSYIIQGNFLVYNKKIGEIKELAEKILQRVRGKTYVPHTTNIIGLPYLEVGDSISIIKETGCVQSFVFKRVLSGIQSLKDEISATGNEKRSNEADLTTQIEMANGKTLILEKTVEELSSTMTDMEKGFESKIQQTAEEIAQTVSKSLDGKEIVSRINQTAAEVNIEANKVNLRGYVAFEDLEGNGTCIINGSNITAGYLMSQNYLKRDETGNIIYDMQGSPTETGEGTLLNLENGYAKYAGKFSYAWLDESTEEKIAYVELKEGLIRLRNDGKERSLYVTSEGISTTQDANNATGVIDFFSKIYGQGKTGNDYKGITIQTVGSPIGLKSKTNHIFVNPESDRADGNMFDFNISNKSQLGQLEYGTGEFNTEGERVYTSSLQFSPDVENPYIKVTNSKNKEIPIYASNIPGYIALDHEPTVSDLTGRDGTIFFVYDTTKSIQ